MGYQRCYGGYLSQVPPAVLQLMLRRGQLVGAREVLPFMDGHWDEIVEALRIAHGPGSRLAVREAGEVVARILDALPKEHGILEWITDFDTDVWGAYFPGSHRIEIYWMAIGLYAPQFGISEEDMTVVVLCHELVHAYTHVGFDAATKPMAARNIVAGRQRNSRGLGSVLHRSGRAPSEEEAPQPY